MVNAALWLLFLLLGVIGAALSDEPKAMEVGLSLAFTFILFGSPISGLLCMLVLALFGKSEESVSRQEEPKERIVYVVTDKGKSPKETEDISRYMPR